VPTLPELRPRSVLQGDRQQWMPLQRRLHRLAEQQCWGLRKEQRPLGGRPR